MTELPNFHATIMMITTLVALYAFSRDNIPIETSSLAVLAFIVAFFELFPYQVGGHSLEAHTFFSGFGHEALIAVAGLMVCGQGLVVTGALSPLGRGIARLWRVAPKTSLLLTLIAGALGSALLTIRPSLCCSFPFWQESPPEMASQPNPG